MFLEYLRSVVASEWISTPFYLYFVACHYRLKDLECPQDNGAASPPRIIDESWLFGQVSGCLVHLAQRWLIYGPALSCCLAVSFSVSHLLNRFTFSSQLIKFATQHSDAPQQQQQLMRLLLDIQSEAKLQRLLRSLGSLQESRLLRHALDGALSSMANIFRQKCIQHAPHINYMQLPPLARVACASLMSRVSNAKQIDANDPEQLHVARALTTLMLAIRNLEQMSLIYIDARHMEKFVAEHLLRQEQLPSMLSYMRCLANASRRLLQTENGLVTGTRTRTSTDQDGLHVMFGCLDAMLQQPRIWWALNSSCDALRAELLEVVVLTARRMLQDTIFYQRHRLHGTQSAPQAIFLAKLIETQIDMESWQKNGPAAVPFGRQDLAQVQVPLVSDIPLRIYQQRLCSCSSSSFFAPLHSASLHFTVAYRLHWHLVVAHT